RPAVHGLDVTDEDLDILAESLAPELLQVLETGGETDGIKPAHDPLGDLPSVGGVDDLLGSDELGKEAIAVVEQHRGAGRQARTAEARVVPHDLAGELRLEQGFKC